MIIKEVTKQWVGAPRFACGKQLSGWSSALKKFQKFLLQKTHPHNETNQRSLK